MKFNNPQMAQILAGEYVLGTLSGPARRRFEYYLQRESELRRSVDFWEARFNSVVETLDPVAPPEKVWDKISANFGWVSEQGRPSLWARLDFWRPLALLTSALAVFLIFYIGSRSELPLSPQVTHVAMIDDAKTQQAVWMLGLMPQQKMLKITAMNPPPMADNQGLELWMLPGKDQAPVSLGMLPASGTMMMPLNDEKLSILLKSAGLAVSLEPKGGSPTGAPTGPVMYQASLYPI